MTVATCFHAAGYRERKVARGIDGGGCEALDEGAEKGEDTTAPPSSPSPQPLSPRAAVKFRFISSGNPLETQRCRDVINTQREVHYSGERFKRTFNPAALSIRMICYLCSRAASGPLRRVYPSVSRCTVSARRKDS